MWVNQLHDKWVVFKQRPAGSVWESERSVKDMLKWHRPEKPVGADPRTGFWRYPRSLRFSLDFNGDLSEFGRSSSTVTGWRSVRPLRIRHVVDFLKKLNTVTLEVLCTSCWSWRSWFELTVYTHDEFETVVSTRPLFHDR